MRRAVPAGATAVVALAAALASCGPHAVVQLGVTDASGAFVPLADGDAVAVVLGPQGLNMVVVALQAWGLEGGNPDDPLDPDNPYLRLASRVGATVVGGAVGTRPFPETGDGTLHVEGVQVPFNVMPDLYLGEIVTLEVSVTDRHDRVATDVVTFVASP
ncbi:MAG TPA: hypothetical protein VG389_10825 [Myxococcota bacterium]|nr:hypothetical protein [Myxococcota bacterium]